MIFTNSHNISHITDELYSTKMTASKHYIFVNLLNYLKYKHSTGIASVNVMGPS